MTVAELIAESRARVIDAAKIEALSVRMKEAEEKFEEEARSSAADSELLSRTYSL